jgi:hypothetical protein
MVVETAGAFPTGSVAIIPWIVRAIRSTPAEATAGEAEMEVAEVINAAGLRRVLTYRNSNFLDSF